MSIWNGGLRKLAAIGGIASASLTGCGQSGEPAKPDAAANVSVSENTNDSTAQTSNTSAGVKFNETFDEAVITEVLEGHHLPPDVTLAGKKTGPLRVAVEKIWPSIKLADSVNKPIETALTIDSSAGPIEIALRPGIAPNHVRNLIALAKLGYYDGLVFERNVHQEANIDGEKSRLDLLVAGCPMGTGEDGYGHLGYFVRAEFQEDIKHTAGTVGFWHEEDPDSAGVRFYITLGPAPALDGKFTVVGQVTKGLDVLKRIAEQPVKSTDPASPENEKPVVPASIKKVVISPDVVEK